MGLGLIWIVLGVWLYSIIFGTYWRTLHRFCNFERLCRSIWGALHQTCSPHYHSSAMSTAIWVPDFLLCSKLCVWFCDWEIHEKLLIFPVWTMDIYGRMQLVMLSNIRLRISFEDACTNPSRAEGNPIWYGIYFLTPRIWILCLAVAGHTVLLVVHRLAFILM